MIKILRLPIISIIFFAACSPSKKITSLIPNNISEAPDYFCTWSIQGYVTSYASTESQRNAMNEENIFGNNDWDKMFKQIQPDVYFLFDDSWDVPFNNDKNYFGSLIVDTSRFPSVKSLSPAQRLSSLSNKIKQDGWKGLGLWICAQQAPKYRIKDSIQYWEERLRWMDSANIAYWKVDWGENSQDAKWRELLTTLGHKDALKLTIEHAMTPSVLSTAAVYRTYDVENVIAIPHTISRIGHLLAYLPKGEATSIINCEDEPYIAVGTGCSIGIMRYEYKGKLPNGVQDFVFPPSGRDLKNRFDEVVRAVKWHKIAAPFKINANDIYVDTVQLNDYWVMAENESWMSHKVGDINAMSAPAIITRGLEKPVVTSVNGDTLQPYILASQYPDGAIAVAAIGRTIKREYITPHANVLLKVDNLSKPLGVFGRYNQLTIQSKDAVSFKHIIAQDLAGNEPVDITSQISVQGNNIIIPGALIDKIGLMAATKGDKSEPGLVIVFRQ